MSDSEELSDAFGSNPVAREPRQRVCTFHSNLLNSAINHTSVGPIAVEIISKDAQRCPPSIGPHVYDFGF